MRLSERYRDQNPEQNLGLKVEAEDDADEDKKEGGKEEEPSLSFSASSSKTFSQPGDVGRRSPDLSWSSRFSGFQDNLDQYFPVA